MPTPADLRRRADEIERQAAKQAAALRRAADAADAGMTAALHGVDSGDAPLPPVKLARIINRTNMDVDTSKRPKNMKIGASRSRREHPAMRAWYEAGKTITDIAAEIGEGRPRVSAWLATEATANRPIPRRHAEYFARVYGVPMTAWQRVAT